ncbi:hypothetical protein VNO77_04516 [Canavalia gladiata]|uniref:Uncharacterized protein n=1 Tax=Canavalia gladiata TaxID=3824 RepID=A0AAN9R4V0_CANGL
MRTMWRRRLLLYTLCDMLNNGKEACMDNPGIATSKFVEPQPLIIAVSAWDEKKYGVRNLVSCLAQVVSPIHVHTEGVGKNMMEEKGKEKRRRKGTAPTNHDRKLRTRRKSRTHRLATDSLPKRIPVKTMT